MCLLVSDLAKSRFVRKRIGERSAKLGSLVLTGCRFLRDKWFVRLWKRNQRLLVTSLRISDTSAYQIDLLHQLMGLNRRAARASSKLIPNFTTCSGFSPV